MPVTALLLALGAALVHAQWNLLMARARDTEATAAVTLAMGTLAYAPLAAVLWDVSWSAAPYILGSAAFELVYFAALAASYRRFELSLIYPLARGFAPVVVLVFSLTALGTSLPVGQIVGIGLVAVGIVFVRGTLRGGNLRGALAGLVIGALIAGYTLIDNEGIEHANPVAYFELVLIGPSLGYLALAARLRGVPALRAAITPVNFVASLGMVGGYLLVLAALQLAPAAPVAAVRETSVVIATALAASVLREKVTPARLVGAAIVAAGIIVIGFS